jgi:glycosyltransferase involved in cell wall biosynthesis
MPPGFSSLRHPILGYFGDMRDKIFDITLVTNLAKFHPEWTVVLVGPITKSLVAKIDDAPVRLIGPVSYDDAPAYLRAFDIAINPLVQNVVSRSMNPLRIYEYLACGLPVVSSPIPDLEIFGDLVIQVSGADRFSFAVHAAMQDGKRRATRRQQAAMQFTWDRLFTQVKALLESNVKA